MRPRVSRGRERKRRSWEAIDAAIGVVFVVGSFGRLNTVVFDVKWSPLNNPGLMLSSHIAQVPGYLIE